MKSIRNAWVSTLVGSVVYYIILLAFGAPIRSVPDCVRMHVLRCLSRLSSSSYFSTTASLAILLSILTIYAPAYTLPIPYFEIFGFASTEGQPANAASDSTASLLDRLTWTRMFSEVKYVWLNSVNKQCSFHLSIHDVVDLLRADTRVMGTG